VDLEEKQRIRNKGKKNKRKKEKESCQNPRKGHPVFRINILSTTIILRQGKEKGGKVKKRKLG